MCESDALAKARPTSPNQNSAEHLVSQHTAHSASRVRIKITVFSLGTEAPESYSAQGEPEQEHLQQTRVRPLST